MTATDRLRALLDEREVEWEKPPGIIETIETVWHSGPWEYEAIETGDGNLGVYASHCDWITPEQAVEATLGRGECSDVYPEATYCFTCSECGHSRIFVQGWNDVTDSRQDEFNYCPNCGARVIGG